MTDSLRVLGKNTGAYLESRWIELINPAPADGRTGEEIAADVIARCGLEVT